MPTDDKGIRQYDSDEFRYYLVELRGFDGLQMPLIRLPDDTLYWPIAAICEDVLHVTTARQVQKLRSSGTTARLMREFKVKTPQGIRRALFLAYDGLAHMLQMLNAKKLPVEHPLRETLPRFQAAALWAVNEVLHGRIKPVATEEVGPSSKTLTLIAMHEYVEFVEQRVENVERILRKPYVNEADDEGIINVPFVCDQPGTYVLKLRQTNWQQPEIVDIVREEDE